MGYGSQPPTHCLTHEDPESPHIRMVYQRAFPMVDVYFDSCCCVEHSGQKQLEEERVYFSFQVTVIKGRSHVLEPIKASHLPGFLRQPRPPARGMVSPIVGII